MSGKSAVVDHPLPEQIDQAPVKAWYEIIGERTVADAILDRLIHKAHRLELAGESMRRKRSIMNQENQ